MQDNTFIGPHQGQPVQVAGEPLEQARAAMILVHGRGGSADDILSLTGELDGAGFAYLAPQAAENSWYPNSFLAPIASNEPGLSSGLAVIAALVERLRRGGIAPERIMLFGFSQGACLSLEFAARNARRYGGIVGLSGALIGLDSTPRNYPGSLAGTPVFLGCSDRDPHIPKARVHLSTEVFQQLRGAATERIYPAMGHTVNSDEIEIVRGMMKSLVVAK